MSLETVHTFTADLSSSLKPYSLSSKSMPLSQKSAYFRPSKWNISYTTTKVIPHSLILLAICSMPWPSIIPWPSVKRTILRAKAPSFPLLSVVNSVISWTARTMAEMASPALVELGVILLCNSGRCSNSMLLNGLRTWEKSAVKQAEVVIMRKVMCWCKSPGAEPARSVVLADEWYFLIYQADLHICCLTPERGYGVILILDREAHRQREIRTEMFW